MLDNIESLDTVVLEVAFIILAVFAYIWFWAIINYKPKKGGRHTYDYYHPREKKRKVRGRHKL